ncbi:helix-turn-helix domain-containing protein [Paenibacillaceae bacterium WGS1546]|uniref:helix-turn-helix domain-containing protein n=1 Tax=Cohnella sp. WGS1546 TaxID=3366810 RepID=UPI00372D3CFF
MNALHPLKQQCIVNTAHSLPTLILCGRKHFEPGEVHARRIFPAFNLILVVSGRIHFREGERDYTVRQGEWFIQTPRLMHYGTTAEPEIASFYFIHFMPHEQWEIAEDGGSGVETIDSGVGMFPPLFRLKLPMSGTCSRDMLDSAGRLISCASSGSFMKTQSLFADLMNAMLENDRRLNRSMVECGDLAAYMTHRFLDKDFSLGSVSDQFGWTRQHVTRLLKQRTGKTFSQLERELKVDFAKKQMATGNFSISEIADALGYNDSAAFSHMFKRMTGESPMAYCKRVLKMS